MPTAAQRLVELSGLSSASAAGHLIAISKFGNTAGERLVSRSSLASATAAAHLLGGGSAFIEQFTVSGPYVTDLFTTTSLSYPYDIKRRTV